MTVYDPARLHEEIAFLAYYLHWGRRTLLQLDHRERQRWCREVNRIHEALDGERAGVPLRP
jgi:uncharacterized protein DUF6760